MMSSGHRPRARELGIVPGSLSPGSRNAITDVPGVVVGHLSLVEGNRICTGVTIVMPHPGNLYRSRVPAGFAIGNGYGKFAGSTQIVELGEIETPIALTNTLSVPEVSAALIEWTLKQQGNELVRSVNPIVGETNDAPVNDIRARRINLSHALQAIAAASADVPEGNVGAGTGTRLFQWKGGIGTSSRLVTMGSETFVVGVLIQTNYGGTLNVLGVPIEQEQAKEARDGLLEPPHDGSAIVVVATDAPVDARNLQRMAKRTFLALGRTGSVMANGSGEYALAFSVHQGVRRGEGSSTTSTKSDLSNPAMTSLFQATIEATEEAVYNALLQAETTRTSGGTLERIPVDRLLQILASHGVLRRPAE